VTQPSSALVAEAETKGVFNGLILGLGAIALLVGAIGVANIMVISVLERRAEIGLRRALGATKAQIRTQFLSEAILLALIGGAIGIGAGALATAIYAHTKHWTTVIPALAWGGGIGAAILIGAVAGIVPAIRAARLSRPTRCGARETGYQGFGKRCASTTAADARQSPDSSRKRSTEASCAARRSAMRCAWASARPRKSSRQRSGSSVRGYTWATSCWTQAIPSGGAPAVSERASRRRRPSARAPARAGRPASAAARATLRWRRSAARP